ncbi:MAG TPA: hypothetical protein VLG69_04720 [Candidatus Andersenbacteria bacterium]|nr:hypothetical protein [Candidatus Andersenbacteria bacterium]
MNIFNNMRIGGIALAMVCAFAFSAPIYAAPMPMPAVWSFTGTVTEVNQNKIELFGINKNGLEQWPKFSITPDTQVKGGVLLFNASDEVRWNATNEIRKGSPVTVWATSSGKALVIQSLAPEGQGDYFGQVDCKHCGS